MPQALTFVQCFAVEPRAEDTSNSPQPYHFLQHNSEANPANSGAPDSLPRIIIEALNERRLEAVAQVLEISILIGFHLVSEASHFHNQLLILSTSFHLILKARAVPLFF